MKHLKKHWGARPLSYLLTLLMAMPALLLFLAAPASAQMGLSVRQPVWAVLDFANPSGYGSSDVGRLASDSFVIQLAKLNRYSVLPREQLLTGIQNESLTPPLNLSSIERLGQSLGVDAIVAGEISSISFSRDRRQAKVAIALRVIDPKSGFLLNGALAEGLSNPRPIPVDDEEQLVNEAFGNAAFNATRQLSRFNLPVATVLISGTNTTNGRNISVTINKGTRDGLTPGLDMMVSRGGRYVGAIKISESTANDANAQITDIGLGIEPGDRATAIYHMPSYSVDKTTSSYNTATAADLSADAPTTPSHSSAFKGITGLLVALVSGGLLLAAIKKGHTGGDQTLGGANVSGVNAVSGLSSSVGGPSSIPLGYPGAGPFVPVSVRITGNIGNINSTNFLEYHVYRSDSPAALSNAANLLAIGVASGSSQSGGGNNGGNNGGGNNGGGNNGGGNNGGNNNGGNNNGTGLLGINGYGQIPLFSSPAKNLQVFDDFNRKTAVTASKPDPSNSSTLVTLTVFTNPFATGTTNTTGTTTTPSGYRNGIPGTELNFGSRVSYSIEGLYIQPATYSTGTTGTINPGTGTTSGTTNTNTNGTTNGGGGTTNGGGGTTNGGGGTTNGGGGTTNGGGGNTNTNGNTSGLTGHGETFQLTGLRTTNTITYIEPVGLGLTNVTSTGPTNVNFTVPATSGANDYILQVSPDAGFNSRVRAYNAPAGAYTVATSTSQTTGINNDPAQLRTGNTISAAFGTAVVFNNINLNADFGGATNLFYRVGARNSQDNGQSGYDNAYIFSNPLAIPAGLGSAIRSSIHEKGGGRIRPLF